MSISLLIIDNYDSFTYNLAQYFSELGARVTIARNDAVSISDIMDISPRWLVISPGPGRPEGAGITGEAIVRLAGRLPILGVCLGHQAIGRVYGGAVIKAKTVKHGKQSLIYHDGKGVFKNIPSPFTATRYHSLVVSRDSFPECLEISAWADDGEIMGIRHRQHNIEGVQFHPESILTEHGHNILNNFLESGSPSGKYGEAI